MLALAPLLIALATALLCGFTQSSPRLQQRISLAGAVILLACAVLLLREVQLQGVITVVAGNWPLPFGIEFSADRLSAALVLIAALMVTITVVWQWSDADPAPMSPVLHPLLHGVVAGACAAFVTADLFNLYVWFEVSLICALGLLVHGGALKQLDATLKYFVLNVFGTLLLLAAVALLYGATGQLNFTALAQASKHMDNAVLLPLLGVLVLAFLIKAAAFPFFAWLPASYHTLPAPVLALFAALLTKIGIYALIRMLSDVFNPAPAVLFNVLGWIGVLSMVTGVLGAAYHWDMRRILAFHSISQIGYILLAIALASRAGDAAAIYFTLHHSLIKAGLFLVIALVFRYTGHYDLRQIGGLYAAHPWLGILFLVMALSLVGIPPFTGFWGKFLIVREGLAQGEYLWTAFALIVSVITLYSMVKIWLEAFWKPHPDPAWQSPATTALLPAYVGVGSLAALSLLAGLLPETLIGFVTDAAFMPRDISP